MSHGREQPIAIVCIAERILRITWIKLFDGFVVSKQVTQMKTRPSGSIAILPSQCTRLAAECVGARITGIFRIFRYSIDGFLAHLKIDESRVFEFGAGEIYLSLNNGRTVEISCDSPHSRSIVVASVERSLYDIANTPDYLERTGLVIAADDRQYSRPTWKNCVGSIVQEIAYLHLQDEDDPRAQNQRALKFDLNGQEPLLIGTGLLHAHGPQVTAFRVEDIDAAFLPMLREVVL